MKMIEVSDTSTSLKDLVTLAQQEAEVMLTEGNQPVAKVVGMPFGKQPTEPSRVPRKLGLHPGVWQVSEDFDAPLPDEFWLGQG